MKVSALVFLIVLGVGDSVMATDEIAHKVLKEEGNIEIRAYEPSVVAEVEVRAQRDEATGKAFRTLFNYISGNNVSSKKIAMTTPVAQEASQKIDMTTPVSQEKSGENTWMIAFYMPNEMSFETTPKPKDKRINIRAVPAKKMIAIRFSGRSTDSNVYQHEKELRDYIKKSDIKFKDKPLYAFYSAPFVPWFLKRNEVLFELK